MNTVNFTPITALTGGVLIGLSVALFFILNGRMIGVSGIASNFLTSKKNVVLQLLFCSFLWIHIYIFKSIKFTSENHILYLLLSLCSLLPTLLLSSLLAIP